MEARAAKQTLDTERVPARPTGAHILLLQAKHPGSYLVRCLLSRLKADTRRFLKAASVSVGNQEQESGSSMSSELCPAAPQNKPGLSPAPFFLITVLLPFIDPQC